MDSTEKFITGLVILTVVSFGLMINSNINSNIRYSQCKVELAKQTKLDTANIIAICSEVYGK